ncbi:MATE family efflux transporter [Desulfococcaceae bacterium HSG9]|nr:MATE family efflux transporter [Desulfococcaceae bacterium HSG9]
MNITNRIKNSQYWEVVTVSLPLVMSIAGTTVMEFTDRVFLSNYSIDAIAASMPSGYAAFLAMTFFLGIAGYLNVIIAQYTGACAEHRIGASLWQGIYFSIFSGLLLCGIAFTGEMLFRFAGHPAEVQRLEAVYFKVLCLGGGINVLATSFSCFYSGRGLTRPVMWINTIGMLFNIPLDYALINGVWIFPELGIMGAGIATVLAWSLIAILFGIIIFTQENDRRFGVWKNRSLDWDICRRLMKFGVPGSLQFWLDVFAFTFFAFMVGRIGKDQLAVTNIVLSINSLVFMPSYGFSLGLSTLTGQALGRNQPKGAIHATKSTLHILMVYLLLMTLVFVFKPDWVLGFFIPDKLIPAERAAIAHIGAILLRFVVIYLFFDALYMVFVGVLKGAGDTYFIMWSTGLLSFLTIVLPIYIGIEHFGLGLYFSWSCITLFIFVSSAVSFWRFRRGKWKEMRVIEDGV